jgi:hypothetical protein
MAIPDRISDVLDDLVKERALRRLESHGRKSATYNSAYEYELDLLVRAVDVLMNKVDALMDRRQIRRDRAPQLDISTYVPETGGGAATSAANDSR